MVRLELGNGTATTYDYDRVGNVVRMESRDGEGAVLFSQSMERDAAGLVTTLAQTNARTDGTVEREQARYRYDAAHRLVAEERRDAEGAMLSSLAYEYDANGNRLRMVDEAGRETTYVYDAANQLLSETSEQGTIAYAYDANGNLASESSGGETVEYGYDFENRLVSVRGPSFSARYALAPDGKRLAKTVNGVTTTYVYDGLNAVEERTEGGDRVAYLYGPGVDELLMRDRDGSREYYHRSSVNSVIGLTDESGGVAGSYGYTAFGEGTHADERGFNPYRYTGRRLDRETGLYHFRERALSTRAGRFVSLDPIRTDAARSIRFGKLPELAPGDVSPLFQARLEANVTGMDLAGYVYTGNNPVNAMDPTGEIGTWNPVSFSITSGCVASGCLASGCKFSGCLGSACSLSFCAGSVCRGSKCIGSLLLEHMRR